MSAKSFSHRLSLQAIQASKKWALNGGPFGSKLVQKDYAERGVPVIRGCNLSGDYKFNFEASFLYQMKKLMNCWPIMHILGM